MGMRFDSKHDFTSPTVSWGFSFALGHGVSFFSGIQHCPVDGCSTVLCNFGVLMGEDECTSFYSTILWDLSVQILEGGAKCAAEVLSIKERMQPKGAGAPMLVPALEKCTPPSMPHNPIHHKSLLV